MLRVSSRSTMSVGGLRNVLLASWRTTMNVGRSVIMSAVCCVSLGGMIFDDVDLHRKRSVMPLGGHATFQLQLPLHAIRIGLEIGRMEGHFSQ